MHAENGSGISVSAINLNFFLVIDINNRVGDVSELHLLSQMCFALQESKLFYIFIVCCR
jgi:hypothetical protein